MQAIELKINNLQSELSFWNSLLLPYLDQLAEVALDDFSGFLLGEETVEGEVSAEFAFESMITVYGRLQEVLVAKRNFWPPQEDELGPLLKESETVFAFLRKKTEDDETTDWRDRLVLKRTEGIDELLSHSQQLDLRDCFTLIHRWRRSLAKRTVLEVPDIVLAETLELEMFSRGEILSAMLEQLPADDQQKLRIALRRYLANEYLFPWLAKHYHQHVRKEYGVFFSMAQLENKKMFGFNERDWDELFGGIEISQTTKEEVIAIMERIAGALREIGDYNELVNQITWDGGQWGESSMVGFPGKVNIIPPNDMPGECCEILLAFAQGKQSPKTGLKTIMRQVREHLIRCGDTSCASGRQTRVAIIFTDLWDQSIFAESINDLLAHHETPPGKVIFGALVNKDRITPQGII